MLPSEFTLQDDFPPASYQQWRQLVEADLNGAPFDKKLVTRTYEGIEIQPLYTRGDFPAEQDPLGFPGLPPFVRGSRLLGNVATGWDLRQEHAHPDPALAGQAVREDLAGGVNSLLLRLDCSGRGGWDPDAPSAGELAGRDGLMIYHVDDLDRLLEGVDLERVPVALESGAAFAPAAALMVALWKRRGVSLDRAQGAFQADPLAVLARDGQLPYAPEHGLRLLAELARWTASHLPHVTAVRVGTSAYHQAGATAAQDLGFGMATAVEYLRAQTAAGMELDSAAGQLLFSLSLGTHHFLAIAKLRAARWLWQRVVQAAGGDPARAAMRIHARTSNRVLTQRDPYVNLLRNTASLFAAAVGGADIVTSVPLDAAIGLPDSFSRRVARNTALVLQEEAHLHRVMDPSGGSWYLDKLTEQLAEHAWDVFQQVERQGGMLAALRSGWVARQIDSAFAPRAGDIARRKAGITGVSEFPDVAEQRVVTSQPDRPSLRRSAVTRVQGLRQTAPSLAILASAAAGSPARMELACAAAEQGATLGQLAEAWQLHGEPTSMTPLAPHPFAEPFERLRDASDAWQEAQGTRPKVFLANMGPPAHHIARAGFSKNFFEAGGFQVLGDRGFVDVEEAAKAFAQSGAHVAVICSSDKLYPELVPQLAARLKSAGARTVVLAGNPGEQESAWREAGVDRFIFIKCDVLATLRDLLREEGVLAP